VLVREGYDTVEKVQEVFDTREDPWEVFLEFRNFGSGAYDELSLSLLAYQSMTSDERATRSKVILSQLARVWDEGFNAGVKAVIGDERDLLWSVRYKLNPFEEKKRR
jgi:hypothetical protein